MRNLNDLTVAELTKAIGIKTEIERLQAELAALLGGTSSIQSSKPKRRMSAAGRATIAAAARARWAKRRSTRPVLSKK
jgi:hypothetical protein